MHPLHEQLQNPLTRLRNTNDGIRIARAFKGLPTRWELGQLALRRYLDARPERFFDETVYRSYLGWLQKRGETDDEALKEYLVRAASEINNALLFLREINSEGWHDRPLEAGDEYELVLFIDRHVHRTYLRMVEGVLAPLIRPVAYFSRIDRGKQGEGLDVRSVMEELKGGAMAIHTRSYRQMIRNGIAHGGITFLQNKIRYTDKRENEETHSADFIVRLCDDLLDTCNGLAVALKVFFVGAGDRGYDVPRQLLFEELQEETRLPWWEIIGCVDSEVGGKSQLIIYANPNSRHYSKVQWSAIQSGILAEYFAPGYGRYFLSLQSPKAWRGWAAFDGTKLRNLRESGASDLSQYRGVVEDDLIFYVPRPALPPILGKIDTYVKSFRLNMPLAWKQVRENLGIPGIECRNASVHRNSWGAVLRADVVIEDIDEKAAAGIIRRFRRRIVRSALQHARRTSRRTVASFLPVGYAQIAVFRRDYRRRRLSGFGLHEDLIGTVRLQRISRIKSPDIRGATIEIIGKWRIAWNQAWLATLERDPGEE